MGTRLNIDDLNQLITDCGYLLKKGYFIQANILVFYEELQKVVNSFEKAFPSQCAKAEQLWLMADAKMISLSIAVANIEIQLKNIRDHFSTCYKEPKIFISHATADRAIVDKLVGMLEKLGVKQSQLFCSSISGYGIPQGAGDLYDYIRNEMSNDNLFVILMLSENYYKSPVCMNEMGAAWIKQCAYQTVLLPGFQYADIKGAVNPRDICFSLSPNENRSNALNEFKDRIVDHLGIEPVPHSLWERHRDGFIEDVDSMAETIA